MMIALRVFTAERILNTAVATGLVTGTIAKITPTGAASSVTPPDGGPSGPTPTPVPRWAATPRAAKAFLIVLSATLPSFVCRAASSEPDRRMVVRATEFASVLAVMERSGATLSPILRDLWDNGPASNTTKGSGSIRASRHHVTMVAHITPAELHHRLSSTDMANGFANRFLMVAARGQGDYHDMPVPEDAVRLPIAHELLEAVDAAHGVEQVRWADPTVKDHWGRLYRELRSRPLPPVAEALTGRAVPMVLRLAVLNTLLNRRTAIGVADLDFGREIVRYGTDTVLHFFGGHLGDERADRMLVAVREAGHRGLTGRERSALFSNKAKAQELDAAIGLLTRLSLCRVMRVPNAAGRPSEILVAAEHLADAVTHYGS